MIGWEHSFVHELHHLLTAIRDDSDVAPHGATLEDGYRAAEVCDAMLRSAEQGGARDGRASPLMADRPADRHARHEGRRVRVPARAAARRRASTCCVADAGTVGPPHGLRARHRRARRSRPRPAPTWRALTDRGAAVGDDGRGRGGARAAAARRGPDRRRARRRAARATRRSPRAAMQALPVGVPKLMVSTMAAGDTRDYVGGVRRDADGVGHRRRRASTRSRARILANAAAAMAGMVRRAAGRAAASERPLDRRDDVRRHHAVRHARARGARGARLRGARLPRDRHRRHARWRRSSRPASSRGVLDATTTELCDDLVGGVLSAGPDRLEAAGRAGLPQVVSLGALDMVNFGARDTVPPQFEDRNLYVHNPSVTLMRTTRGGVRGARPADRAQAVGARPGRSRCSCRSRGVSMIDARGPAVPRPRGRRGAVRRAARRASARTSSWSSSTATSTTTRSPTRWPTSSTRYVKEARDDRRRGARQAARDAGRRRRDHRRRRRHRAVGQVRRGRRHRPDHHLQLRPLPDGGPRLARRADALRRRERDRHGDGPARCCRSCATRRCWPASAAPTRSG